MFSLIGLVILLYIIYLLYHHFFPTPNINPNGKYVLISGCDTGVGHALAIELDRQGFNVLVGVYLSDSVISMQAKLSTKATVFRLDITKQEDIDATYELVKNKTNTLHALVNNSGIIAHGCIDWTSLEIFRKVMNVNFFGHVAMTKKFLPLVISKRDSRVVNVCSATGFFAFPNTSAYSASKHALESFSDCLRREMAPWGMRVSIIEPGSIRTSMLEGYADSMRNLWNELSTDVKERWGIDYLNSTITQAVSSPFITHAGDPSDVVRAIQHAVINTNPRIRYRPGWQAKLTFNVLYLPPAWLIDKLLAKATTFTPAGISDQHPS
jgi:NAD(P)-dependent dehydrogenase (short-subunit alcohol dehydrogenase family)